MSLKMGVEVFVLGVGVDERRRKEVKRGERGEVL